VSFPLHKLQIDPASISVEAVDFGHRSLRNQPPHPYLNTTETGREEVYQWAKDVFETQKTQAEPVMTKSVI
jgi:hypothetical protein